MTRHLLAALALLAAGPAVAQTATPSRLDAVIDAKELRICTTGDYKPFSFHAAADAAFEGVDIDLGRSLAKALGVEPRFVKTGWATLADDVALDRCDIAMGGVSITLERQKRAAFSQGYLVNGKAPIARCGDEAKYDTVAEIDRPEVRVVVNPGGTNETFVRQKLAHANIRVFPDNRTIFDEILQGRADVMVAESIETRLQQKLRPGLCAVNPDQPLQYGEMGYLLPRGDVAFKAFVDQWLHLAKATGEFQAVYDAWMK